MKANITVDKGNSNKPKVLASKRRLKRVQNQLIHLVREKFRPFPDLSF